MITPFRRERAPSVVCGQRTLWIAFFCAIILRANATVIVTSGIAEAGADFGSSSSPSIPPTGPSTINGFYDFRDLQVQPSGGLGAQGWAGTAWQISGTLLLANGTSTQGFNGAYGTAGWVYGWGHAKVKLTLKLNRSYSFVPVSPTNNVRGVGNSSGTAGFLGAGIHNIEGAAYGSSGGFNLHLQLTALPLVPIHYFAVGVDWQGVNDPANNKVRGNLDAEKIKNRLAAEFPNYQHGVVLTLDATESGVTNFNTLQATFDLFKQSVPDGDSVILLFSSHGGNGEIAISEDQTYSLISIDISRFLDALPLASRKIVILDVCDAAGIGRSASLVQNSMVLTATAKDGRPIGTPGQQGYDTRGNASVLPDGSGVFSDLIDRELGNCIYDVGRVVDNIRRGNHYGDLVGQELYLKLSGTAPFGGIVPQAFEHGTFDGSFSGQTVPIQQALPQISQMHIADDSIEMSVANVPTEGSLVLQSSTDLTVWTQETLIPANGINASFSIPRGSEPSRFFRIKMLP